VRYSISGLLVAFVVSQYCRSRDALKQATDVRDGADAQQLGAEKTRVHPCIVNLHLVSLATCSLQVSMEMTKQSVELNRLLNGNNIEQCLIVFNHTPELLSALG